jgi:hypothetical protein
MTSQTAIEVPGSPVARAGSHESAERVIAGVIILLALAVQISAALRGGAIGQDFPIHYGNMLLAAGSPVRWIFGAYQRTNPPLFCCFGALVFKAVGKDAWPYVIGVINACLNVPALVGIYVISRWLLTRPVLRLSLLCFIAFLPAFQITSVVFAADTYCQTPFVGALIAIVAFLSGRIGFRTMAVWLTAAVAVLVSLKYTAVCLIPAGIVTFIVIGWIRRTTWRSALSAAIIYTLVTGLLAGYWIKQQPANISDHFEERMGRALGPSNQMNLRSILFFRYGDLSLLGAPAYWKLVADDPHDPRSLFHANYFSYPGLLCLATFSDVLNIFQPKPKGVLYGQRTKYKQRLTQLASGLGVVCFIGIFIGFLFSVVQSARELFLNRGPGESAILILATFAFSWHVLIIVLLMTVTMATAFGYWLPRLILPSLMVYPLVALRSASVTSLGKSRIFNVALSSLVLVQSAVHALILT